MSTLQTLMALVVLIFVLSVIVQAVQEFLKSLLKTKADTMEKTIQQFMGAHLTLPQVEGALKERGLDITALEHFNKDDFRHLLDGIDFLEPQLGGIVCSAAATFEQKKDNIAAAYEAARASFQKTYTTRNKIFALIISFGVVLALNANLIMLYQKVAEDQVLAQAIVGKVSTLANPAQSTNGGATASLEKAYQDSRDTISSALGKYPAIVRDSEYGSDFRDHTFSAIVGLLLMGLLVSLGAPFWNDVLKGMTGVNNALNTGGKKSS
jgi:hypothetical protein